MKDIKDTPKLTFGQKMKKIWNYFTTYEKMNSYIPEDKEEYKKYLNLLPKEIFGRKKNKTF